MTDHQNTEDSGQSPAAPTPEPTPVLRSGMDLTKGSITKTLIIFSLPIVLQMSIQPLFGVIDRVFIARIGADAFNAVTNAATIQMLAIMLAAGLANGITSYVARLVGKGDLEEADNAAVHAMIIMLIFSVLFTIVVYPFDRQFFAFLGMREDLMDRGHDFIKIIALGNITIMFTLVGANILRGEGNSRTPLTLAVISVIINIIIAPPLIFGREEAFFGLEVGWFGLDVMGGSLATVIARAIGAALLIGYLLTGKSVWTFTLKNFHWRPRHIIEILRVGFPMLLVNLTAWVSSLVFLRVLNEYKGAVEAWGMGVQFDMLAVLPMIGLMLGVVSMVGQNCGAGNLDRAKKSAWAGAAIAAGFSVVVAVAFVAFPDPFVSIFNKEADPDIQRLGVQFIYIVAPTYAFVAIAFVLAGAFQGLGMGMPPLIMTVIRFFFVSIPIVLILPRYIGPVGAWVAMGASHVVGGFICAVWIKYEFRRRERIAGPGKGCDL